MTFFNIPTSVFDTQSKHDRKKVTNTQIVGAVQDTVFYVPNKIAEGVTGVKPPSLSDPYPGVKLAIGLIIIAGLAGAFAGSKLR